MQKLWAKKINVYITDTGLWRIDKEFGKCLVVIALTTKDADGNEITLTYVPTHDDFCESIIDKILDVELQNDLYEFKKGIYGKNSRRPTQIFDKIEQIRNKLYYWEWKAMQAELTKPKKLFTKNDELSKILK